MPFRLLGLILLATALTTCNKPGARSRKPVCFNNRPNNQTQIIRNVFRTFYVGEFQPYLSLVDRWGREWLEHHQRILSYLPVPTGAQDYFLRWINPNAPDGIWQRYLSARDRHTRNRQRLSRRFGMMPGG